MKKISFVVITLFGLFLVSSCKNKNNQTREERIEEFRSMLTASDTVQMLQLCDNAMEQLKAKNIDQVIASLHEYNDSTGELSPLSEQMKQSLQRKFKMFPVLDYKKTYYSFMLEGCNDVQYEVTFSSADQAGTEKAPTVMYMFNPVKVDDEWKLCVKTPKDEIDAEHQ